MSRLSIEDLPIKGLKLIKRQPIGDHRGFLTRLFCKEELLKCGWNKSIEQINHTYTAQKGTVRGLHYQVPPHAEMKLVSCLQGVIWDVAIDLRANSDTFLHWYAAKLSAENGCALLIPEGFAHGFQSLSSDVQMLYCHSACYEPKAETGINVFEPRISINWPLDIAELSERDQSFTFLDEHYSGVALNEM